MDQVRLTRRFVKPAVFVLALLPFLWLIYAFATSKLGANPVETITHETGEWGLRLLLLTLLITPLRRLTAWSSAIRLRRMLGLFAFFYVVLHFTTYLWLDQYFSLSAIVEDIAKRPYVAAGFTGFVALVPLALTSTKGMVRRLGGKNWQRLHRLVYVALGAALLHFIWLVKADLREPLIYTAIALVLLALRVRALTERLRRWRLGTRNGERAWSSSP